MMGLAFLSSANVVKLLYIDEISSSWKQQKYPRLVIFAYINNYQKARSP